MKITKKVFVETMTSSMTYFAGETAKPLSKHEVYLIVDGLFNPHIFLCLRSCKERSSDLKFNDGSYLSLYPRSKYSRYDYPENSILMITHPGGKTMYYIIRKVDQVNV